jgi:hypothetical protein
MNSLPFAFTPCGWESDAFLSHCRPPSEFIPPVQEPYQYIIFRASEVKDLSVDETTPVRSVHDDPAVLGVCHSRHHVIFHILSSSIPLPFPIEKKYNNDSWENVPSRRNTVNFRRFLFTPFLHCVFRTDDLLCCDVGVCTHRGQWLSTIPANDRPACAPTATTTAAVRPATTAAAAATATTPPCTWTNAFGR